IWTYDGANVAAVQHGAGRLPSETALELAQGGPHLGNACDDGGGLASAGPAQARVIECGWVEGARRVNCSGRVIERPPPPLHLPGDRPVEETGGEAVQAKMGSDPLRQRALAGRGRSIDGNDHGPTPRARPLPSSRLPSSV